jgi:protein TonB
MLAGVILMASSFIAGPLLAAPAPQGGKGDASVETVRVGGDIKPPMKVKNVLPVYPPAARSARVEGVVILEATIGTDGKVKDVKVVKSVKLLDDAAVSAVRECVFKPTLVNGQPVQVIMTVPFNFTLQ